MTQNQIRYLELQETARANAAKEAENIRSNKAKEQENYRSNFARETETALADRTKEAETNRSNLENERLNREKLDYEKYGNKGIGGTIRTIKAGINDVAKATGLAVSTSTPEEHAVLKQATDERANYIADKYSQMSMEELENALKKSKEVQSNWKKNTNSQWYKQATQNVDAIEAELSWRRQQLSGDE